MRIISGKHKGRRIMAPKDLPVRPTTDQAKEALFNILRNQLDFSSIKALDLFSGIGSISLELGSRGVNDITAVDSYYKNISFLRHTTETLDLKITPIKSDVFEFLERTNRQFDLIFADPPYPFDEEALAAIRDTIFRKGILLPNGLFVMEHSKHKKISDSPYFVEERRYGSTVFSFFKVNEEK